MACLTNIAADTSDQNVLCSKNTKYRWLTFSKYFPFPSDVKMLPYNAFNWSQAPKKWELGQILRNRQTSYQIVIEPYCYCASNSCALRNWYQWNFPASSETHSFWARLKRKKKHLQLIHNFTMHFSVKLKQRLRHNSKFNNYIVRIKQLPFQNWYYEKHVKNSQIDVNFTKNKSEKGKV